MVLTDAELTILGLLVEAPRHGYDLEKVIDERGIRNWTALGFSSIYYVLDKLAARGLIEPTATQRTGKSRTPYRATQQGRRACAQASLDAVGTPDPLRARTLVGMANSPAVPAAKLAQQLARRADALQARLAEVRAARAEQQPLPFAASAIFDYSEAMLRADLAWTRATHAALAKD